MLLQELWIAPAGSYASDLGPQIWSSDFAYGCCVGVGFAGFIASSALLIRHLRKKYRVLTRPEESR